MDKKGKRPLLKKYAYKIFAVCFWIFIWEAASRMIDQEVLLASPGQVLITIFKLAKSMSFWQTIAYSSLRIILGFLLALFIGTASAVLSYQIRLFEELVMPAMKVIKSIPVASFIILALIWIHSKNLSVLISFLIVLPLIYTNVLQGLKAADLKLLEMAEVFRLSWIKRVKAIYLPAVQPFLLSAVSVGLGFGFKAGIAAEVIGLPAKSIGERLYEAKLYLMTKELFAWSIVIILISVLFEKAVILFIPLIQRNSYQKQITDGKEKHGHSTGAHSKEV